MSSDARQLLQERMAADPALAAAIPDASTPEDVARIAAEHGITLPADGTSLSDATLDGIAGGIISQGC